MLKIYVWNQQLISNNKPASQLLPIRTIAGTMRAYYNPLQRKSKLSSHNVREERTQGVITLAAITGPRARVRNEGEGSSADAADAPNHANGNQPSTRRISQSQQASKGLLSGYRSKRESSGDSEHGRGQQAASEAGLIPSGEAAKRELSPHPQPDR